jgi:2-succinyl-5-enolpyruvyl-6-hydroxy-3-cyclohexene-1-carboxylate synthase
VDQADISLTCAWALVDEFVRAGATHACVSPGSRSTPLALALARHPRIELHVHLDERSSAFFALGLAKTRLRPVLVACTSGTAVAELLPAVVEASQSRMPLVLLTADRPARLRGTGANQTIDQPEIFGGYVRASLELPAPTKEGHAAWWRQSAREALDAMAEGPPGPVHVNCPFEEPLTPSAAWTPPLTEAAWTPPPTEAEGMHDLGSHEPPELEPGQGDRFAEAVDGARGVVTIGGWPGDLWSEGMSWSQGLGWPVLAEPTSNARLPQGPLSAGQALIGSTEWLERNRPEVVIQFGATPTTRATQDLMANADRLIVADRFHLDTDPERRAWMRLHVDPNELSGAFADRPIAHGDGIMVVGPRTQDEIQRLWDRRIHPPPAEWTETWRRADNVARTTLDAFIDGIDEPFEPRIARDVAAAVPDGGLLFVGNSKPIRDLDLTMAPREGLRVMANRGASGIDGLVSTAMGIAAAGRGPTFSLLGDLSFLHDAGALLWNATRNVDLVVVIVSNGGGQIFSLLPQLELPEHRELFTTPSAVDLEALCAAARAGYERVERGAHLVPAIGRARQAEGIRVIDVIVDPESDRRYRVELQQTITAALG